jgi:succinate dehydrogenase / fumarate reductase flavoprotein subunit
MTATLTGGGLMPSAPSSSRLDANVPKGSLPCLWDTRKRELSLATRARRRGSHVLVVGAGLAGAATAASLSELGHRVTCLCFHDSPRRAHSVAAQGGINACKNYQNDGDSADRLFYDTLKGGDYRSREANVYRLAQLSVDIIDQCVAQGVPFAREYAGHLANRSFGGALVARTFYARGITGQQLLLGAYQALSKEVARGGLSLLARREMLDLVVQDGVVRGVIARHLVSGELEVHLADAVVLATGGYANVFQLSTNAQASNATAVVRAYERGAAFANPSFVQFHPTCLPPGADNQSKLVLMARRCATMGASGYPPNRGTPARQRRSRRNGATTIWSACTLDTATWRRATWRHARRRPAVTRASAWARAAAACTWICATPRGARAMPCWRSATATCSRCIAARSATIRCTRR